MAAQSKAQGKQQKIQERLLKDRDKQAVVQFCLDWLKQDASLFMDKQRAKWRSARGWVSPKEVEEDSVCSPMDEAEELFCVCRKPYDEEQFYFGCDGCSDWLHPECLGMTEDEIAEVERHTRRKWYCPTCIKKRKKPRRRK